MKEKNKPSANAFPFAEVLTVAPFRHLWFGQIASQLALNTLLFVLGIRVYETTGSNTAVSVLFMVYGIAALLFGVAGGTIVDKLDKRVVLVTCDFTRAFIVIGLYVFSQNIIVVYLFTFVNAVITQFYVPAEAPTIPRFVPARYLVMANSLFSFTYFTSLAAGSILAGPFLRLFGPVGVFFSLSVLFIIAGINVWFIPNETSTKVIIARLKAMQADYIIKRVLANIKAGIDYALKEKALREALMLLAGTQVILAILGTLGPGFADRVLEIDIRDASLIITGPVVTGIILGALWLGYAGSKLSVRWLINRGIISAGLILIAISIFVRLNRISYLAEFLDEGVLLVIILLLFFFLGVANSLLDVPANSILQRSAEGDMRGRVYGMLTAAVGGIGVMPVILGGLLADTIGVGKVILIMGSIILGYGLYRIRYNGKININ